MEQLNNNDEQRVVENPAEQMKRELGEIFPKAKPMGMGKLLLAAGLLLGVYAFFIFDVSHEGMVNFGLLAQRQSMLIVAGILAIVGAILFKKAA